MISPANGKLCSKNYKEWITRQIFLAKNLQNLHHTRSISSKEKTGPSSGRSIGDDIYENNRFLFHSSSIRYNHELTVQPTHDAM